MAHKEEVKIPDKEMGKIIKGETKLSGTNKQRRFFRSERIDEKIKEGWKVVGDGKDEKGKHEGVRTHSSDLTLMEK